MSPFCASLDFEKLIELEYSTFTTKVTLGQAVAVSDIAFWEKWT
jgi:NO-binding membrane sensor protein with MHYT domain